MVSVTVSLQGLDMASAAIASLVRSYLPLVAQKAGAETVAHLRSLTDEMRPPARRGEGERRAHPGHWADITGQLAAAYQWDVQPTPQGADLKLTNSMEYAEYLERRSGFFVLSGATDPGGFVDQKIQATWAQVKPIIERKGAAPRAP